MTLPLLVLLPALAACQRLPDFIPLPAPVAEQTPLAAPAAAGFVHVLTLEDAHLHQVPLAPLLAGNTPAEGAVTSLDVGTECPGLTRGDTFVLLPGAAAGLLVCGTALHRVAIANGTLEVDLSADFSVLPPGGPFAGVAVDAAGDTAFLGTGSFDNKLYRVDVASMTVTASLATNTTVTGLYNINEAFVTDSRVYFAAQSVFTAVLGADLDLSEDSFVLIDFPANLGVGLPAMAAYDPVNNLAYIGGATDTEGESGIVRFDVVAEAPVAGSRVVLEDGSKFQKGGYAVDLVGGELHVALLFSVRPSFKTLYVSIDLRDPAAAISSQPLGDPFDKDRDTDTFLSAATAVDARLAFFIYYEEDAVRFSAVDLGPPCPNDCSGSGSCSFGICDCDDGFDGLDCSLIECPTCFNGFACDGTTGLCDCGADSGFGGANCTAIRCPFDCSGHGVCSNDEDRICTCEQGWQGDTCAEPAVAAPLYETCGDIDECSICTGRSGQDLGCGWCESEGVCFDAAEARSGCQDFYFDGCAQPVVPVISYTVIAVTLLLLLVNMVSMATDDRAQRTGNAGLRSSWWRCQRSAKAWMLVDRLQFVALIGLVGATVPSLFSDFSRGFTIFLFAIPIISVDSDYEYSRPLEKLRGVRQLAAKIGVAEDMLLANVLVSLAIVSFAVIGVLVFVYSFQARTMVNNSGAGSRRVDPKKVIRQRAQYAAIRLLNFGYSGLVVFSAYHVSSVAEGGFSVFLSLVGLLLCAGLGILYPMLIVRTLRDQGKTLFQKDFRRRLGALYEPYHFKKAEFYAAVLLRKFLVAFSVGIAQGEPSVSLAAIVTAQLVYSIYLVYRRPYLDRVHFYNDVAGSIADLLTACIFFAFLGNTADFADRTKADDATGAIGAFQLLLCFVAIMTFVHSWLQKRSIFTIQQFFECLSLKKSKAHRDQVPLRSMSRSTANTDMTGTTDNDRGSIGVPSPRGSVEVETVVMQRGGSIEVEIEKED